MAGLDFSLIQQARKLANGTSVRVVNTWILCYETSLPDSPKRTHYEECIRKFVVSETRSLAARAHAEQVRAYCLDLRTACEMLEEKMRCVGKPRAPKVRRQFLLYQEGSGAPDSSSVIARRI